MNHSPNCEEWFIEKMKQNGQKLVELIVVHITTRLKFTTLRKKTKLVDYPASQTPAILARPR